MEKANSTLLKNGQIIAGDGSLKTVDILIKDGIIAAITPASDKASRQAPEVTFDLKGALVTPGLVDVHVHFREPGRPDKETILTGSQAAAHGGYTCVCTMPNLSPAPDSPETLKVQTDIIERDAVIDVIPYATITKGRSGAEVVNMAALKDKVAGFSDDGSGVQTAQTMKEAMTLAAKEGCIIAAHCEDNSLLHGGYIHDGRYAAEHGHRGICSESEWEQIERDIALARETGCAYHVCHISTKESVALIREAKASGVNITCETGPHYLVFTDDDLKEEGRFKMNPPLRTAQDRAALIEGIIDGTIDMIATDHAPHTYEEKHGTLEKCAMGVVGIETAFAVVYTHLVKTGVITLERAIELLSTNARARFSLSEKVSPMEASCPSDGESQAGVAEAIHPYRVSSLTGLRAPAGIEVATATTNGVIAVGARADLAVFDLEKKWTVDPEKFLSKGKATPFEGMSLYGECLLTLHKGATAWKSPGLQANR